MNGRNNRGRGHHSRGGRGGRGGRGRAGRGRAGRGRAGGRGEQPRSADPTANDAEVSRNVAIGEEGDLNNPPDKGLRSRGLNLAGFDNERQRVAERKNNERFIAHFGTSAATALAVFEKVKNKHPKIKEKDFLLALNYLKLYESYRKYFSRFVSSLFLRHMYSSPVTILLAAVMSGRWKLHEDTIGPKWKAVVEQIASLHSEEIVFDPNLFEDDEIFWITVDGVNFTCTEPRANNPGPQNYDHKSNSAGVSYEVAVAIRHDKIVHIAGPFLASTSEIQRFRGRKAKEKKESADPKALIFKIPDGKRAVADSGLKGEPDKITTSRKGHAPETKEFLKRAKSRQETLFSRFKNFHILRYRFRHDIDLHRRCLLAVAVIVQIDMSLGNGLFEV